MMQRDQSAFKSFNDRGMRQMCPNDSRILHELRWESPPASTDSWC